MVRVLKTSEWTALRSCNASVLQVWVKAPVTMALPQNDAVRRDSGRSDRQSQVGSCPLPLSPLIISLTLSSRTFAVFLLLLAPSWRPNLRGRILKRDVLGPSRISRRCHLLPNPVSNPATRCISETDAGIYSRSHMREHHTSDLLPILAQYVPYRYRVMLVHVRPCSLHRLFIHVHPFHSPRSTLIMSNTNHLCTSVVLVLLSV